MYSVFLNFSSHLRYHQGNNVDTDYGLLDASET